MPLDDQSVLLNRNPMIHDSLYPLEEIPTVGGEDLSIGHVVSH